MNKAPYSHLTFEEVLKHKIFWLIMTMELTSLSLSFFLKSAFKDFGSTKFNDDKFLTMLAGVGFLSAAVFRFIWGALHDISDLRDSSSSSLLSRS